MNSSPIHLPQPCAESWAAMPATGPGRHCAACQRTVVDFSAMSQADVLAYLARAGSERVCGAFRPDQVQVPAGVLPASASAWRRWAAAALTLLGLRMAEPAAAQAQAGLTLGAPLAAVARYPARVLRGQVVEVRTNQPLAGVSVLVEGAGPAVLTDAQGRFELRLPPLPATAQLHAVPASSHFAPLNATLPAPGDSTPFVLHLFHAGPQRVVGKPLPPRAK